MLFTSYSLEFFIQTLMPLLEDDFFSLNLWQVEGAFFREVLAFRDAKWPLGLNSTSFSRILTPESRS